MVLTFLDRAIEIDVFRGDFKIKEIILKSNVRINIPSRDDDDKINWDLILPRLKSELRKIFLKSLYLLPYKAILAFDSKNASTRYETVSVIRDNPKRHIDEADLENIISQAIWKVLEDSRRASTSQLALHETDILFADTTVHSINIDAKAVLDPLGSSGKVVDIHLSQTFVNRSLFQQIASILPKKAKIVLVVEGGVLASQLLAGKDHSHSNFVFAKTMRERTDLFAARSGKGQRIAFWDYFKWGEDKLYADIGSRFNISSGSAKAAVMRFLAGETSKSFHLKFKEIISDELITLVRGLRHAADATNSTSVYLDFHNLARLNFEHIFPKMIQAVDAAEFSDSSGFRYSKKGEQPNSDFLSLAAILGFYSLPGENLTNHLAKRRMKWLMPENN